MASSPSSSLSWYSSCASPMARTGPRCARSGRLPELRFAFREPGHLLEQPPHAPRTRHVNGAILWANLHLLFWLSLVPFTTGWMGGNHFAPVPTAAYGVVLLLTALAYSLLQAVIIRSQGRSRCWPLRSAGISRASCPLSSTRSRSRRPCSMRPSPDVLIRDGEELEVGGLRVRCMAAPGHAEGLVVYEVVLDAERVWFTSDLFEAKHAHSWVDLPWTGALDFDRFKYIQSLARLLKLPPCDHLLPGHGPAAIGGGRRLSGDGLHRGAPEVALGVAAEQTGAVDGPRRAFPVPEAGDAARR